MCLQRQKKTKIRITGLKWTLSASAAVSFSPAPVIYYLAQMEMYQRSAQCMLMLMHA